MGKWLKQYLATKQETRQGRTLGTEKEVPPPSSPLPPPPLEKGWQVVWLDQDGKVRDGYVDHMTLELSGWVITLTNGETLPARKVRAVGRIENGKKLGGGEVGAHGLSGPSPDDWQTAWRAMAALTDGIRDDDSRFKPVMELLDLCDEAYAKGDYLAFHELKRKIETLVENIP